ncbi:MAG: long-chain fatty acid--CoA ligase [Pseudomonadota bacterium]
MAQWNEDLIAIDEARTLDGLFARRVRRSPDREAYRAYDRHDKAWRSWTWKQMGDVVARWQHALAAEDLHPGDRIAVLLRNCPEWVMLDQAALSLGLVVVPLYTDDRPDNSVYILEHAGVKALLVQDAGRWKRLAPSIPEDSALERVLILEPGKEADRSARNDDRVRLVADWLAPEGVPLATRNGKPGALASIVYTSGTTGRPKGVMLSHHNMLWVAHAALTMLDVYQQDVFLSFLPLSHALERSHGYYMPLMAGSTVIFARSVGQLAEDLKSQQPTVLIAVPRIFERVYGRIQDKLDKGPRIKRRLFETAVALGWHRFSRQQGRANWKPRLMLLPILDRLVAKKVRDALGGRLRACASGGAPLCEDIARFFIGLGVPVLQGYGLTESSPLISVNVLEDNVPASVGVPLRGLKLKVGEHDELLVRGPNVMLGYWNDHKATAEIISPDGFLHTGDQARIENNHIFITGRLKDILVLSNGEKVPPADMEMAISLDPLFEQVMVVGEGRPYLTALAVLNADLWPGLAREYGVDADHPESLYHERIIVHLLRRIRALLKDFPGYAKIRRISLTLEPWTIENGLITPTLKVKRQKVLEHHADAVGLMYEKGRAL